MVAVEENDFQSKKTDASLYNGRPTGTGAQCHSVGAASRTLSIPKDKDGVSVGNVLTPNKQWFVLRVSYGRVLKVKEIIDACNIDCFAPMRHKQITKHGKKHISHNIQYKLGDHVIVTEGDFEGIQGRVARIAGQQRVIVELFSGCLVATAYIPKEAMMEKVKTVRLIQ